jgi:hypothetical protein
MEIGRQHRAQLEKRRMNPAVRDMENAMDNLPRHKWVDNPTFMTPGDERQLDGRTPPKRREEQLQEARAMDDKEYPKDGAIRRTPYEEAVKRVHNLEDFLADDTQGWFHGARSTGIFRRILKDGEPNVELDRSKPLFVTDEKLLAYDDYARGEGDSAGIVQVNPPTENVIEVNAAGASWADIPFAAFRPELEKAVKEGRITRDTYRRLRARGSMSTDTWARELRDNFDFIKFHDLDEGAGLGRGRKVGILLRPSKENLVKMFGAAGAAMILGEALENPEVIDDDA